MESDLGDVDNESARSFPTTTTGSETQAPYIEADSFPASGDEEDGEDGNSTRSLTNSVWTYTKENGRTYHGYRAGSYPFPNDPTETDRLDFQYALVAHLFEERLHFAPISNPSHVLDIGTGTGTWAIDMGDLYPSATVEGTDLSPIQPTAVPDNVHFIIDDAEQEDWAVPFNHYDYIHTRMMLGCFTDFRQIISQAFRHLKPGGWFESQECMSTPYCDDGTMPADWPFKDWTAALDEASMKADRPLRIANKLKRWMTDAGFVDVHERIFKLPVNTWPRDPAMKALGTWWHQNLLLGLQGFSLAYLSRMLGWTKDEIEVYLVNVRRGLANRHVHAYHKIFVVYGRKPEMRANSSSDTLHTPRHESMMDAPPQVPLAQPHPI